MKIALLGYGRMGKEIEKISLERNHEIVIKTTGKDSYDIKTCDIAIDFSLPEVAFDNISLCLKNNIPVVSGTTGWLSKYEEAVSLCEKQKGAFIYASNFSLGVNIFFELNNRLANMMQNFKDYNVSVKEIHHTKKLDAPSGTAISLADGIINNSKKESWSLDGKSTNTNISITAIRTPDVPGTHNVSYKSEIDTLEISHIAHSRKGFALGAVVAAEWLLGKTGVFTMKDVLDIK